MYRIDDPSASSTLPPTGAPGLQGFFTAGNPATNEPATVITADFLNTIQEELVTVVNAAGLVPSKADRTQLFQALQIIGANPAVRQPTNITPAAFAAGVGGAPTLLGRAYYSLYGIAQAAAQFQVSTVQDFATTALDHTVASAVVTYALPDATLSTNTNYWWRVRYQDTEGTWSPWSVPTSFTTSSVFVRVTTPSIASPVAGAVGVALPATLTSSAFAVVGGSDPHTASRWRVTADAAGIVVLHDSSAVSDLTSYVVPYGANLTPSTTYYAWVMHQGAASGWSSWSAASAFSTAATAGAQSYTTPGAYTFTVPAGVTSVCALTVGGGGGGALDNFGVQGCGGGGGGLRYLNDIAVIPGQQITVTVGAGGAGGIGADGGANGESSSFGVHVTAYGGGGGDQGGAYGGGAGGGGVGGAGGNGGAGGGVTDDDACGGGGAGGYTGDGGAGGKAGTGGAAGNGGAGGGGGGGPTDNSGAGYGGGGVGLNGAGASGGSSTVGQVGKGGSGGAAGGAPSGSNGGAGGAFGGGGAASRPTSGFGGKGGDGAVRVIWGTGRSFPNNAA